MSWRQQIRTHITAATAGDPPAREQQDPAAGLRAALRSILYLRAKLRAQTGAVPTDIQARIAELSAALAQAAAVREEQSIRRAIELADDRASTALAAAEVEVLLS